MENESFFKGKLFAGPMVRASSLPFRLFCLESGADGVYGPATSADSILAAHYDIDEDPYTMFYGWPTNPRVMFHTSPEEKGKLVFQLLANDPVKAVQAASVIVKFADAIDLNCGCPESFATSRNTGSALMNNPEVVSDVVAALRRNFDIPISVKHRIMPNIEKTIQFAVACQNAGASAIAVHGRIKEQKNKGSVEYENMKMVFEHINVTKVGNGGVKNRVMAKEMMDKTGCDSVIISSAALKNPTVFSDEPHKNPLVLARRFTDIAIKHKCTDKYEWRWGVCAMLGKYRNVTKTEEYEQLGKFKDVHSMHEFLARKDLFQSPKTSDAEEIQEQRI